MIRKRCVDEVKLHGMHIISQCRKKDKEIEKRRMIGRKVACMYQRAEERRKGRSKEEEGGITTRR